MLYIMLMGEPPFNGPSDNAIMEKVKAGKYKNSGDKWDKLSAQAREFVQLLLTYNPKDRPSASDCLQHAFITEVSAGKIQVESAAGAFDNISSFKADQKLKRAAYAYIASQVISKNEKEDLSKIFKALDKNGDGKLSKEEIMDGFENIYGRHVDEDEMDEMFKQMDLDGSGTIEYTEFIAASMNQKQMNSKEKMNAAFKLFDKDNSGTISAQEIKEVLGAGKGGITEKAIEEIIKEVDEDENGEISLDEFEKLMTTVTQK